MAKASYYPLPTQQTGRGFLSNNYMKGCFSKTRPTASMNIDTISIHQNLLLSETERIQFCLELSSIDIITVVQKKIVGRCSGS